MMEDPKALFKPSDAMRELQFLEELEKNPSLSQRELSNRLGTALGVTNACIKQMVRRGWIRLKKAPPRRTGYYLTPKGFTEKAKLTVIFLSYNIHHYARLKAMIEAKLLQMASQGVKRVIFYGVSDEMEIAYVTLQGTEMDLVAIVDDNAGVKGKRILGNRVKGAGQIDRLRADAILVTSVFENERIVENLKNRKNQTSFFTIT